MRVRKISGMSNLNDKDHPDRFDRRERRINTMLDRKLRLLIAEKEYLIAIDAGEIISGLLPCEVTICTLSELEQHLEGDQWDLALIDVASDPETNTHRANMILSRGAGLVFLTGHSDLARGVPGLEEWPVATKPFSNAAFLAAVVRALSLVGKI
jgi:hypothetical protein